MTDAHDDMLAVTVVASTPNGAAETHRLGDLAPALPRKTPV